MPTIILAAHGRITTHHRQDIGRGFLHNGIDQGHSNGTAYDLQIMAPAAGAVVSVGRQGTYGLRIVIRHDDGSRSLLAHHAKQFVKVGQRVTQGELIAVMGNTGTKYVHSHQELWTADGVQLDPLEHLSTSAAASDRTEIDMAITEAEWARIDLANAGANENLLRRIGATVWGANLTFTAADRSYDGTASDWLLNMSNSVAQILAKPSTVIDPAKLAAELAKAGIAVTIDTAAIARAVDASLRDDFAAIPGAVVGTLKAAL